MKLVFAVADISYFYQRLVHQLIDYQPLNNMLVHNSPDSSVIPSRH